MGIGLMICSITGAPRTLGNHSLGGGSDVYHRWCAYLRHYHCVWDVLSGRVRILIPLAHRDRTGLMSVGRSEDELVDGFREEAWRWVAKVRGCIVRICIPASKRVANFTRDWLSGGLNQHSGQ